MILLATAQELGQVDSDPLCTEVIDDSLYQIITHFLRRDERALFETVGTNGERLDSPEGRCLNPGHAIETAWFMMQEGCRRDDSSIIESALDILNWSLEWGWDDEYGGILSFVDIEGRPPEQLEWDMKLWWPHTEALYALLLAHHITGEREYADWYEKVHEWSFKHFPDPKCGEWFGYLHRDGSVSLQLKGSLWKGPFHLPRALMRGIKLLEEMRTEKRAQ
jgi:N-acylglucosamine 2-epimerase